jgi:hypothetical protein
MRAGGSKTSVHEFCLNSSLYGKSANIVDTLAWTGVRSIGWIDAV